MNNFIALNSITMGRKWSVNVIGYTTALRKLVCCLFMLFFSTAYAFSQQKLSAGEHFADVNGVKLHYYVSGKGPVCLAPSPGWGAHVDYMRSLTPFEKHFTMVYYDTRKSGLSSGPDDPTKYTDQDLVNDMDSLRAYFGLSKVWLTGHSGGGYQVLNYGSQHNANVNGIIALDAMALYDSLQHAEMLQVIKETKNGPEFEKAKAAFFGKDTVKRTMDEFLEVILPLYFTNTKIMRTLPKLKVSDKAYAYTDASNIFKSKNLLNDLHNIKVPVLVVVGDGDFICGVESEAKRIHARIPTSQLVIVKNAGHLPWIEQPGAFYKAFEQWAKAQHI
ncbi:alpha/beta fold hydrolase [Chitinophaga sp. CF418]|uniref:alpha/beta fold hydrolase n=1 Tax=Chitinophaga sp. CF418 TaxID=1855287 RepID=UPI0009227004|nr:alpha/beta hydrolase [Chitinophaga sp. CF418]SHN36995.1 Pimeloyl-ACP methyl ester carboxylesterase [Chitinophaga sp. CF418]